MSVIKKSTVGLIAGAMIAMASAQVSAFDLEAAKTNSKQNIGYMKTSLRNASKKEADKQLKQMKAEAVSALNARLRFVAKKQQPSRGRTQQPR